VRRSAKVTVALTADFVARLAEQRAAMVNGLAFPELTKAAKAPAMFCQQIRLTPKS
jgi:hypothetical protein